MTLVARSTWEDQRPLDQGLLDDAPTGSRLVFSYSQSPSQGIRYVKRADGDWDDPRHPTYVPASSFILTHVWGNRPLNLLNWWLRHPGLVKVCLLPVSGRRGWFCRVCDDLDAGFDSVGAAADDARAHVANHAEIARAL